MRSFVCFLAVLKGAGLAFNVLEDGDLLIDSSFPVHFKAGGFIIGPV